MSDARFPYGYGPTDSGRSFHCPNGSTVVHVRVTAPNEVTMVFFEKVKWLSVSPNLAFRIAWLLLKYGAIALWRRWQ